MKDSKHLNLNCYLILRKFDIKWFDASAVKFLWKIALLSLCLTWPNTLRSLLMMNLPNTWKFNSQQPIIYTFTVNDYILLIDTFFWLYSTFLSIRIVVNVLLGPKMKVIQEVTISTCSKLEPKLAGMNHVITRFWS